MDRQVVSVIAILQLLIGGGAFFWFDHTAAAEFEHKRQEHVQSQKLLKGQLEKLRSQTQAQEQSLKSPPNGTGSIYYFRRQCRKIDLLQRTRAPLETSLAVLAEEGITRCRKYSGRSKASRPILSSKAVSTNASFVSENQLAGSRGTGYGTEKGDDLGSTNPWGVDNGGGSPEHAPLVNAKPRGAVEPEYPEIAQQNNWEGRVIVKAYINADGSVGEVQGAKSSGHLELDEAALAAVKRTKFEPAKRGDEVVATWVRVPVTFALQ